MPKRRLSPDASVSRSVKHGKYLTKFNSAWINEFPWIKKSSKSLSHALCSTCNVDFSVGHSGRYDIVQHSRSDRHLSKSGSVKFNMKVSDMFGKAEGDDVSHAELLFSNFVVEHNLPFLVADHFTLLVKEMFPDSAIAKKFSCMRTKTTNIVNKALGVQFDKEVTALCRKEKFSLMIDESNDQGDNKSVTVLIRVFDESIKKVTLKFLGLPTCNIGTGENLFNCLNEIFINRDIPWSNCIGYSSDNASVMVGKNNSVLSRVREHNPDVFNVGCVCHLANLCAQDGIKALPLPIEDLLIDVYFHFFHSAKRKEQYKEYLDFTDTDPYKIVKHCSTRWLSLQSCITRLLQQWPALQSYFASHDESDKPGRVQRCRDQLIDHEMHLYYLFLQFILPVLNEFNTTFQAGTALIGHLHSEMYRLLRKLMGKFVKTEFIAGKSDVTTVDFMAPDHQHDDSNIAVGLRTREYIREKTESDDISPEVVSKFFRYTRKFYQAVVGKMIKRFPFHDGVLRSLGFLCPDTRQKVPVVEVVKLCQRFRPDLPVNQVEDETEEYLLSPSSELPQYDFESTELDDFWVQMGEQKLPNGKLQYGSLSKVAITCLSIAHSNADAERSFSMLRKIQSDCRGNLSSETVHSLLSVKINNYLKCHMFKPNKCLIRMVKSVCN